MVLLTIVLPSLGLIWVSTQGFRVFSVPDVLRENEDLEFLGLHLAVLGAPVVYLLVLLGQWRCLKHAPQCHGAKELMFTCFFFLLLAPPLLIVAHYIGGYRNYRLLLEGLDGLRNLNWLQGATLMQVGGLSLLLANCLLFAQFLRAVGEGLEKRAVMRTVDCYTFFLCLLLGGSVGTLNYGNSFTFGKIAFLVLIVGWLWYLCCHVLLTYTVRRHIKHVLVEFHRESKPGIRRDAKEDPPQRYSGLHRVLQGTVGRKAPEDGRMTG
jgi:hypothetical protein